MGLKTASVWLADNWSVTTKALNEQVERFIEFDLKKVTAEGREELVVRNTRKDLREHYTRIQLWNLSNNAPSSQQIDKIKRHLASIYRKYLRDGDVEIFVNGVSLSAPQYAVLKAAYYKTPNEEPVLWKKEIRYQSVDGKYRAEGFFAILDRMQANANGLVLMRKGRVIVGGGEERFFPHPIFGQPGGFRYRRIFGELELDGFEVTFNKNGFRDEDNLNALMGGLLSDEVVNGVVGHNDYGVAAFANIDLIPVEQVAIGFEYKQGVHVGDGITNHDYFDGHVAWFVTDSLTLVGAYAYTGDKDRFYRDGKTDRLGVGGGFVLSIQYQF